MSGFTRGPWLHRGKSDSVHVPHPDYPYGDEIFRFHDDLGPSDDDLSVILAAPLMHTALTRIAFRCLAFIGDDRPMQIESIQAILKICDDAIDQVNQ
jgi:hypothetical protein